ncbi:MAG: hypothetical protein R2705_21020 [Ilumatobacteraceae bacterium]
MMTWFGTTAFAFDQLTFELSGTGWRAADTTRWPAARDCTPVTLHATAAATPSIAAGIGTSTTQPGHIRPICPGSRVSIIRSGVSGTNRPTCDRLELGPV